MYGIFNCINVEFNLIGLENISDIFGKRTWNSRFSLTIFGQLVTRTLRLSDRFFRTDRIMLPSWLASGFEHVNRQVFNVSPPIPNPIDG